MNIKKFRESTRPKLQINIMNSIKEFYDDNPFPGFYSAKDLDIYKAGTVNPYIKFIDRLVSKSNSTLDLGCGTGLICNFLASKYPYKKFIGLDFSNAIDYAKDYAVVNNLQNIKFIKDDILSYRTSCKYDLIICQGVLHHIPNIELAIEKIHSLLSNQGILVLGLYHPIGKQLKKLVSLNYKSNILYKDQELHPYEECYTFKQTLNLNKNLRFINAWPNNPYLHFISNPLKFSRSGGLVIYSFSKI